MVSMRVLDFIVEKAYTFKPFVLLEDGSTLMLLKQIIVVTRLHNIPVEGYNRTFSSFEDAKPLVSRCFLTFQRIALF